MSSFSAQSFRGRLEHPIGVFDSGVGGLTVLKALREKLPARDFIYFADTARVPYGRKPREMVERFAFDITCFLLKLGVEAEVIALRELMPPNDGSAPK